MCKIYKHHLSYNVLSDFYMYMYLNMIHKIKGIFCDHEQVFGDRKAQKKLI